MANLQEIAQKFRISDNFLNSKEDGLVIVSKSINDLISQLSSINKRGLDENEKQSLIEKLERLSQFCNEVKNSSF